MFTSEQSFNAFVQLSYCVAAVLSDADPGCLLVIAVFSVTAESIGLDEGKHFISKLIVLMLSK